MDAFMEGHTEQPPPAYRPTPRRPQTGNGSFRHEHHYALQDKSGRDWVSFKVKSRAADPKHTPLFFDGDTIKGEVQFDLAKAETLKGLTITVCASLSWCPALLSMGHCPSVSLSSGPDVRETLSFFFCIKRFARGTKELSAPAYILGARKSRIHRLQTTRDCAPQRAAGE